LWYSLLLLQQRITYQRSGIANHLKALALLNDIQKTKAPTLRDKTLND